MIYFLANIFHLLHERISPTCRFEKSLYDLIRGLRSHKGSEAEYIQNSLKECKSEIKSPDMDKKTIALLKLIYLEMFGYDMSWASFHVLEVMSSPKHLQKRIGYLAAAQSFRAETEVLMLATNLLKKDIVSSSIVNLSLPLATLPHIVTPSLAMSLLNDLLPRLSHSNAVIRKKSIVVLYRFALVYPETLRLAWPKLKERLMDDNEDSSVIAAVMNVILDSGNNWMAIKIIKLFATLTPLEPRLVRKLLRPLISIIQTTTAMSLLYECINGIIQGGILTEAEGTQEGDEIASLCVTKLRGMVVMDADPNLRYVALLAFNRIVISHPHLVAMQQNVIMDCLDDPDISIRLQSLELAVQMATPDTLQDIVNRLLRQLLNSRKLETRQNADGDTVEGASGWRDAEFLDSTSSTSATHAVHDLPTDYKSDVVTHILDICSRDNYADIVDFEWYVEVLEQLLKLLPHLNMNKRGQSDDPLNYLPNTDIAVRIGAELRSIAVRVKAVREKATKAGESFLFLVDMQQAYQSALFSYVGALGPIAWIAGEYSQLLSFPDRILNILINPNNKSLPGKVLILYLQAMPKVFLRLISSESAWPASSNTEYSIVLSRLITFLEGLGAHPDLDVQERATEFLELLRLAKEALQPDVKDLHELPFLLADVIPSLFKGLDLNSVSIEAQKRVPLPEDLDLDQTINVTLPKVIDDNYDTWAEGETYNDIKSFYYVPSGPLFLQKQMGLETQIDISLENTDTSHGNPNRIQERFSRPERNRDDPFYIGYSEGVAADTVNSSYQVHDISNKEELDIDSIPIIDLTTMESDTHSQRPDKSSRGRSKPRKYQIAAHETIDYDGSLSTGLKNQKSDSRTSTGRSLLQVDTSGIERLALSEAHGSPSNHDLQPEQRSEEQDLEMAEAMRKIERARLEMQRASERINVPGLPSDGQLIKKKAVKKKKKKKVVSGET
ncbi:AP-3 complex subunit delta, putative [Talaromyces stipitatus ATCC 10500]|uniref:AP-3 complex subunit delta n=1 Tax=Talaromyces stipitatus (strain ATCC 10500 / CBS 375.48 / QM 6759 / NRRL 1006) TaxID=441959 RepID=B8M0X8_TALSN|nr:AP-3 complex subunit delta, putative [Talaromyces stipitatus ATCC 10500]EED21758.1 AP-3 complex subunit delta, putative [Talaromyces stipitatus ATCC 10500]